MADLSTSAACDLLKLSPQTVRNLADAGELPHRLTSGGHRRFAEADLVAYQAREATTAARPALRALVWRSAALAILREAEADLGPRRPWQDRFERQPR
ncbi:unnamed protein product, partial [Phaeothamnion confervicola]